MYKNIAKITNTFLGVEDHGIFTFILTVTYGEGLCQGIGTYVLDEYDEARDQRVGTAGGMEVIMGILRACGVSSWEELRGRTIFVLTDGEISWGAASKVLGIENLPTEPGRQFLFASAFDPS